MWQGVVSPWQLIPRLSSEHYIDVIMTTMASQITSLTLVYSTVYSDADQRKHQSSASLVFVWGIHRDRWIPHTKGQLRGFFFHLMTSSCLAIHASKWIPFWGFISGLYYKPSMLVYESVWDKQLRPPPTVMLFIKSFMEPNINSVWNDNDKDYVCKTWERMKMTTVRPCIRSAR